MIYSLIYSISKIENSICWKQSSTVLVHWLVHCEKYKTIMVKNQGRHRKVHDKDLSDIIFWKWKNCKLKVHVQTFNWYSYSSDLKERSKYRPHKYAYFIDGTFPLLSELDQSLLSFEKLDRASPDLWPEQSECHCVIQSFLDRQNAIYSI